ncbi:hypothetical protein TraAM80_08480 [Trypanosoma rangeli]|uniref:Uncharacterized protein n=1 Tax=Trypanosoma rangeli TaxID=5698 RepID=A0A422N0I6_TRYRA|nr:uncharacterized protein TraAM80_08480 [Trypanosoma rangeli]RNE98970.1 hypothetical protein TraAM80_08480 [Trypanosoma rangeli]|eukprot:RNE98970.1 hypothetical protein TraAM80_08480 [Trypanosoma rangeli]
MISADGAAVTSGVAGTSRTGSCTAAAPRGRLSIRGAFVLPGTCMYFLCIEGVCVGVQSSPWEKTFGGGRQESGRWASSNFPCLCMAGAASIAVQDQRRGFPQPCPA